MGGFGSGRSAGPGRNVAESCRSLDVNRLNRAGCLAAGYSGGWEWKHDGERVGWIRMWMDGDVLVLDYKVRRGEGAWREVTQRTPIEHMPCRYGGTRPWFVCPGVVAGVACGRRVGKLFAGGNYFLCRHCYRVAYASQSERTLERARRRARKLHVRLGGDGDRGLVRKPKGRWRRTQDRLVERWIEAEVEAETLFEQEMAGYLARVARRNARLIAGHGGRGDG